MNAHAPLMQSNPLTGKTDFFALQLYNTSPVGASIWGRDGFALQI
jgi:hypothetical protein